MGATVRITRNKGKGSTNGVPHNPTERVYVTGPHFSRDIYSSTLDPNDGETLFDRSEAERLLALGHWSYLAPEIEDATVSL
jgi:hypothetical protein